MGNAIQYCFERYEKKYFLTPAQQEYLRSRMEPYVKVNDYGEYTTCNIYYDTDDWRLVRESIEKPAYKEKLRVRSYGVPAEGEKIFVELKKKCGGIVYKRRISTETYMVEPFLRGLEPARRYGQIGQEIAWFQKLHQTTPKVFIACDRTAFAGIDDPNLRITFDTNMRWRDTELDLCLGDNGKPILSTDQILMEVKMPGACPLWLSRLLSEAGAFPISFSKYGTCYRDHLLKGNMMKTNKGANRCA